MPEIARFAFVDDSALMEFILGLTSSSLLLCPQYLLSTPYFKAFVQPRLDMSRLNVRAIESVSSVFTPQHSSIYLFGLEKGYCGDNIADLRLAVNLLRNQIYPLIYTVLISQSRQGQPLQSLDIARYG